MQTSGAKSPGSTTPGDPCTPEHSTTNSCWPSRDLQKIPKTMRNMKLTCANVADDRGLIMGTSGYDSSWNLWMIVEFINSS